jgi:hypothetical protein
MRRSRAQNPALSLRIWGLSACPQWVATNLCCFGWRQAGAGQTLCRRQERAMKTLGNHVARPGASLDRRFDQRVQAELVLQHLQKTYLLLAHI